MKETLQKLTDVELIVEILDKNTESGKVFDFMKSI
jgi:hypothetical protein